MFSQSLKTIDFENPMFFDFSSNHLTETSLRAFASSIRNHSVFREINMSNLSLQKCKDATWFELANAVEKNK
jgi:hypothetical protein